MENNFLELHKDSLNFDGFWSEISRSLVINTIESYYKREITREWYIADLARTENNKDFLAKWQKRYRPLTDDELISKYGSL